MSRLNIYFAILVAVFAISYFLFWNNKIYKYKINGIVREIKHDDKGYPIVKINGKEYGFSFGKTEIVVGDSIAKLSNSYSVYHYRNGVEIGYYEW